MVAGLGKNARSNNTVKATTFSKGMRNRAFDAGRLPPNAHCSPQRRFILRSQFGHSASYDYSEYSTRESMNEPTVAAILESFTCLCLGSTDEIKGSRGRARREKYSSRRKSSKDTSKRVMYPIASYPVHLNSKRLVEQRRKSLPHHFFRPVSDDELMMCRPRTA